MTGCKPNIPLRTRGIPSPLKIPTLRITLDGGKHLWAPKAPFPLCQRCPLPRGIPVWVYIGRRIHRAVSPNPTSSNQALANCRPRLKVRPSRFSLRAVVAVPFRTGDGGGDGGRGQLSSTSDRAFLRFNFRSKSEIIDIKHFFLPRASWPLRTGQIQK